MPSPAPTRPHLINFPPFQLDLREGILRREAAPVTLRPKTFAVLRHLAEHPSELVSKQALLDAVWGDVAVSEEVVRLSIFELRAALGDDRATPRFIETVPRRGTASSRRGVRRRATPGCRRQLPRARALRGRASWSAAHGNEPRSPRRSTARRALDDR